MFLTYRAIKPCGKLDAILHVNDEQVGIIIICVLSYKMKKYQVHNASVISLILSTFLCLLICLFGFVF